MSPPTFTYEQYIEDVLSGKVIACHWVQAACKRHRKDLDEGKKRGLYFDHAAAKKIIVFFSLLKHSKGEWAGRPITLEPWQQFILAMIFGWKKKNGFRRFRTSYLETARKSGKTTIAAGVGLYLMLADDEPGAEIYSVATKRDQARLSHSEATRMVKSSPEIRRECTVFRDNIHILNTASKFEPLGADADTLDGLNVHGVLADEIHKWNGRDVWDVCETATGSRRQSLMFAITTAGYDRQSLCFQQHEYTEKVLDGIIEDDSWFGVIFTLDKDDDWEDESVWIKANPNLHVSKKIEDMRLLVKRAKEMPSQLNAFLRLHLDIWTQSVTKWISVEHWEGCGGPVDADGLRGRTCYGGLDLSSNTDISAFLLVFPPEVPKDTYKILARFFIPEMAILERVKRDRVPYDVWVRQGFITATPGEIIDYEWIIHQIDEDMQAYDLREIAFDRWGASKIQTELMDLGGSEFMVQFGQGYASMSPPTKDLERLIIGHQLSHGNNPVLTWMANNLVVVMDAAGNYKPDKEKSTERIDGMVALIMAMDRAMRRVSDGQSVYEERGLETV